MLAIKRDGCSLILGVVSLILMTINFLSSKSGAARAAPAAPCPMALFTGGLLEISLAAGASVAVVQHVSVMINIGSRYVQTYTCGKNDDYKRHQRSRHALLNCA